MYTDAGSMGSYESAPIKPELSKEQDAGCEQLIILLLSKPDHEILETDLIDHAQQALALNEADWQTIHGELKLRKIIKQVLSDSLKLNLAGLVEAAAAEDRPAYVTPELEAAACALREGQKSSLQPPDTELGAIALTDRRQLRKAND